MKKIGIGSGRTTENWTMNNSIEDVIEKCVTNKYLIVFQFQGFLVIDG